MKHEIEVEILNEPSEEALKNFTHYIFELIKKGDLYNKEEVL